MFKYWEKPNGAEIRTNDDQVTSEYCLSLGWVELEQEQPKRKRRTKAEMVEKDVNRD